MTSLLLLACHVRFGGHFGRVEGMDRTLSGSDFEAEIDELRKLNEDLKNDLVESATVGQNILSRNNELEEQLREQGDYYTKKQEVSSTRFRDGVSSRVVRVITLSILDVRAGKLCSTKQVRDANQVGGGTVPRVGTLEKRRARGQKVSALPKCHRFR